MALAPLMVALARGATAPYPSAAIGQPVRGSQPRRAFRLGLLTGVVYFAGTLYWLVETMTTFGGLATPLAVFAALVLVAYLSLFPAAFAVATSYLVSRVGVSAILMTPCLWISTELGRQYIWDGFPWELLGYSQVTVLPVAQLASLVGVYGISALLAFTSAAAAYAVLEPTSRRWIAIVAAVLMVGGTAAWGQWRIERGSLLEAGEPVRVAVLQGNIAQEDKWNPALRDAITDRYLVMTRQALAQGAMFILWPESSTPFYFEHDLVRGAAIRRLARESGATLLIGSDQVEPLRAEEGRTEPGEQYYNAAFLVKPDGEVGAVYRKMHLVPFGEYIPAAWLFSFVGQIVPGVFVPGTDAVLLPVGTHTASTAICYEVIYGSLIREFVVAGSELLTTITNDAWYGESSAAFQHWDQAAMRAIEGGRYLARAANTGISGFVDPYGRVVEKSALFEQALLVGDLRFLRHTTVYTRIGDLIAWLSLALSLAALIAAGRIK
jgi:apolipoprotein N-acyltransferase